MLRKLFNRRFRETGKKRLRIDIRNPYSLKYSGFDPLKKNVIIIHGFNGTESKTPMTLIRNGKKLLLYILCTKYLYVFELLYTLKCRTNYYSNYLIFI